MADGSDRVLLSELPSFGKRVYSRQLHAALRANMLPAAEAIAKEVSVTDDIAQIGALVRARVAVFTSTNSAFGEELLEDIDVVVVTPEKFACWINKTLSRYTRQRLLADALVDLSEQWSVKVKTKPLDLCSVKVAEAAADACIEELCELLEVAAESEEEESDNGSELSELSGDGTDDSSDDVSGDDIEIDEEETKQECKSLGIKRKKKKQKLLDSEEEDFEEVNVGETTEETAEETTEEANEE